MNKFLKDLWLLLQNEKGGGGGERSSSNTTVYTPTPAAAPTSQESMDAWVKSLPAVYEAQMKYEPQLQSQALALQIPYAQQMAKSLYDLQTEYEPKMMEQEMQLQKEYMPQFAQAQYDINKQLYPQTSGLQETLAGQAAQGATATSMPDWMRKQYLSDYNAELGSNAGSPIGADYVSRGMQNQLFQQQKYYRDLGLSLAGRQPLITGQQQQTPQMSSVAQYQPQTNYMSQQTPAQTQNFMANTYGTYTQAARPIGLTSSKSRPGVAPLWGLLGSY